MPGLLPGGPQGCEERKSSSGRNVVDAKDGRGAPGGELRRQGGEEPAGRLSRPLLDFSVTKVVTGQLHQVQRGRGKGISPEPRPMPVRRPTDQGELADQAEAARRLGLTRARLTQVLDQTVPAPEVQERIPPA